MATRHQSVSVTTTATQLNQADVAGRHSESHIVVHNDSAEDLTLGGSGVTTAAGIIVAAGATSPVLPMHDGDLYGVVATGPADVRILQTGA